MAEEQRAMNSGHQELSPMQRCATHYLHLFVWIAVVAYAMVHFATSEVNTSLPQKLSHVVGGTLIRSQYYGVTRYWDLTDREWREGRLFLVTAWPWLLLHSVIGRALAHLVPSIVYERNGEHAYYVTAVAFYWTVLRCFSFCMDTIRRPPDESTAKGGRNFLADYCKTLAYAVYLPPLFLGPVQNYSDFAASMEKPKPSLTVREIAMLVAGLLRSGAHFLLMDLLCHYFYSAALTKAPYLVSELDNTSLLGYGAILNIMFYSKYLIQYGVSGCCARIEGHNLPAPPKCVSRGHLCSHFWRYFDHGLHLWIKKYVYLPIVGTERKVHMRLLAIAVAFTFVWIWHSMTTAVTFWASLSTIGVAVEVAMAHIKRLDCAKGFEDKYLNPERRRIVKAILGSPHYLLTISACMFYLVDMEITTLFLRRVILGFPMPLVPVLVSLYFGAYASQDIMESEAASAAPKVAEPLVV